MPTRLQLPWREKDSNSSAFEQFTPPLRHGSNIRLIRHMGQLSDWLISLACEPCCPSVQTSGVRLEVHVRPSASVTYVGGTHDGALVVRVVEPPDSGRATDAVLRAVARAVKVPHRSVSLLHGATSRRKLLGIEAEPAEAERIRTAIEELRNQSR